MSMGGRTRVPPHHVEIAYQTVDNIIISHRYVGIDRSGTQFHYYWKSQLISMLQNSCTKTIIKIVTILIDNLSIKKQG